MKISRWIRLNLFIPDAKRFWRRPAVALGKKIIQKEQPDLIFSTSPPPTTNLIAMDLARYSRLPWVADFRDPWTKIYYLEDAPVTKLASRLNERLESQAIHHASFITAVNDGFFPHLDVSNRQTAISNGFDPDDYPTLMPQKTATFTIRYFGQWKENQQPPALFELLKRLSHISAYRENVKLECYGSQSDEVIKQLTVSDIGIPISFHGFVPKGEALKLMMNTDLLLLIIGKSNISSQILSTKIFDYLYVRKPILGFGPTQGSAANVLHETGCGIMFDFEDLEGPWNFTHKAFEAYRNNKPIITPNDHVINKYAFDNLTDQLIDVFQKALEHE